MTTSSRFRNRPQNFIALWFGCLFLTLFSNSVICAQALKLPNAERAPVPGSATYFPFSDVAQVIQQWSPRQHLYVQGSLGLTTSQLMGLESWIHQKGPHWTVILMEDASFQRYTNREGRIETGMDAVELSVSDLMEVGSFRSQTNPITGEQDATVFILFLRQRKFSYRASEAQNRRGLGQNRWIGKLDRPAFRAMRGGGRILDAVRDTITSINLPLSRAVVEEQKIAEQKRIQRQREIDEMLVRLGEVENKLERIQSSASEVKQALPDSTADLTNPDIASITKQMSEIKLSLKKEDTLLGSAKESTDIVDNASDDWINLYREYERFETSEKQLQQRSEQLQEDAGDLRSELGASFSDVEKMLTDARGAYEIADSKFQNHLNSATYALENATSKLQTLRTELAQKEARKTFIQRAIATIGSVFAAIFAGLLLWLNRKRAPAKDRAKERLVQREKEVRDELDGMGELLKRADVVIGDREAIARKGYQGKTKDLSSKALDDIDQILVMSSSVDKVIDEAKQKIEPTSLWTKVTNWWSPENFNEGFELLENKPIEFDENEGIALVREHDAINDPNNTDGDGPQKISLSFTELFKIFRERSISANETIGQVESGWTQIVSTNKDLQNAIDEASQHEQKAREATEADGLLHVPQLFDELLKSAQADQDEAESVGKTDPISAIEGPATTGLRKAANADELARQLTGVRTTLIPSIRKNTQGLDERKREIDWVDAALDDFTDRAQQLATDALTTDVSDGINEWRVSFEKFDAAVSDAVRLHDLSVNDIGPTIETELSNVDDAKQTIARRLNLSPDNMLTELNRDAVKSLNSAREHNAACLASLDRGDPPAAELSATEAQHWIEEAKTISARSLEVLDSLLPDVQSLETRIGSAEARFSKTQTLLAELQDRFAKSSLTIEGAKWGISLSNSETESSDSDGSQAPTISVADLFLLAKRQSEKAQDAATSAKELYAKGRLLSADESLELGQQQIQCCEHNQKLIEDLAVQLQQMVEDNAGNIELLQKRFEDVAHQMQQHHVTYQTHALLKQEHQNFSDLRQAISSDSVRRDPFNEASAISAVDGDFEKLLSQMEVDRQLFEEASRSVKSLVQAIEQSNSLVTRSQRDQIPDSRNVQQSIQSLQNADKVAAELRTRLQSPHENWRSIDQDADKMLATVTDTLANLQSELDAAQTAANEIRNASVSYQRALSWSGGYGIRANPGSARGTLDQARALLGRGEYQGAVQYARKASQSVLNAIAIAETAVMTRQAAERRAAERRRRAAQRRRSNNRSILSGGGRSRSRSSGSRSRSSSRSSSSGRGGFSRSGW